MNRFEKVKKYYDCGLWDVHRVRNAVDKDWITADEFEAITEMSFSEVNEDE